MDVGVGPLFSSEYPNQGKHPRSRNESSSNAHLGEGSKSLVSTVVCDYINLVFFRIDPYSTRASHVENINESSRASNSFNHD